METPKFTTKNKMEELKQCCRDNGFRGFSNLRKAELIEFVNENLDRLGSTPALPSLRETPYVTLYSPVWQPEPVWSDLWLSEPEPRLPASPSYEVLSYTPIRSDFWLPEPVVISEEEDTDSLEVMTKVLELCETHMNEGDYLKSANLLMKLINKH